jgi:carboxyl-terminal processing protease
MAILKYYNPLTQRGFYLKYMNRLLKTLMIVVPMSLVSLGFYLKTDDVGEEVLLRVIVENLKQLHYSPPELNDEFSEAAFESYLNNLDRNKRFLLQSDIDQLSIYRSQIDNETLDGKYAFFDQSIEIIQRQIDFTQSVYREILSKPFDYTKKDSVVFAEDDPYAQNEDELREKWHKYLKYSVMTRLARSLDVQESAKAKLEEVSHPADSIKETIAAVDTAEAEEEKSFEQLEEEARKGILKTHDEWFERLARLDRKDRLATYVNSITLLYDPHTGYFPPADKDNFDIRMSGRLEGIGAQLQEKDGYIKVVSIVPGSPSALQGELQANDLILKVAQGNKESVDIVNARIDDAVKIIRGKKGTEVRLTVQKPDGSIKVIPIIRDVIVLEETYAKSTILNDQDEVKVGYLYLPSFYTDFNDPNGRTSWKDVRNEIRKIKKDGAEALIFDLRNNGGGSLPDVVEMAGLFIPKGPIVQVKSRNSEPRIMTDNSNNVEWDKPLIIMVNEFSASASEILAAAMQDYNRAIIVGSHTTHGKGTVQRFVELNRSLRSSDIPDLGALKLTTQKFYRINGGATQLKGVTPDIIWPDNYTYIKTGEREQDNAMQWDQIKPAKYQTTNSIKKLEAIKRSSETRTNNDVFKAMEESAKRWKVQRDNDRKTLNLVEYRTEKKELKEVNDVYSRLFKPFDDLSINNLTADAESIATDSLKLKRTTSWHKSIKKDVYLFEALQIAEELVPVK